MGLANESLTFLEFETNLSLPTKAHLNLKRLLPAINAVSRKYQHKLTHESRVLLLIKSLMLGK